MPIAYAYWGVMLIWLLLGGIYGARGPAESRWPLVGSWIVPFILFALLGWVVFGAALK